MVDKYSGEKIEALSENDLFFVILSDCENTKSFFETLYQVEKFRQLYKDYWENHKEGNYYVYKRLYPENSSIPFSFMQSIILLDQIRRGEKQEKIYDVDGYAERLDRLKDSNPIIFPCNEISFLAEENKKILGIGCISNEHQNKVDFNISNCAMLDEYIYTFPVNSEI